MRLTSVCAAVLILATLCSIGCWLCDYSGPITDDMVVGEYEYISKTGVLDERVGDRVVLKADHTYVLTRAARPGSHAEEVGIWKLRTIEYMWKVDIDDFGYVVRITHNEVQLLRDDDVGLMFMRPRKKM